MKLFVFFWLLWSSVCLAEAAVEKFHLSCQASQTGSEESLSVDSKWAISQRPSSGAMLGFNFKVLSEALPYEAKIEMKFGKSISDDSWTAYFTSSSTSENFGWSTASLGPKRNEIQIQSITPDQSTSLTLSCVLERVDSSVQ